MPDRRRDHDERAWTLEVVRGADPGRRYPLPPGETTAGNAANNGTPGLNLAPQESGPRRMAARQARFLCRDDELALTDLGSPGGTFVNRQRLVPFQPRRLAPGDIIQMAGVQLRVARGTTATEPAPAPPPPAPTPPAPSPRPSAGFAFAMKSGMTCRSWDDFLTASAQDWAGLRDELVSGRLAAFLAATGRAALAPDPHAPGSPDERLDAWLAAIPSTRTPAPELEVHPETLAITTPPHGGGGGLTRRTVTVTNTGYRLLRTTARVEPPDAAWLRLAPGPGATGAPFTTLDRTTLTLEITLPDAPGESRAAALCLTGNGGDRRVTVTVSPRAEPETAPAAAAAGSVEPAGWDFADLRRRVGAIPPRRRLLLGALIGMVGRAAMAAASAVLPGILGPLAAGAVVGAAAGVEAMRRRGTVRDLPAGAAAGGVAGVLAAAVAVAAAHAVESALGITASWLAVGVWGAIGLAAAAALATPRNRENAP